MVTAPLVHSYNLARLGSGGDEVRFEAGESELAAIALLAGALALSHFNVVVTLKKASPTRFMLDYRVEAEVAQACVVTLEPVVSQITNVFSRELHFAGRARNAPEPLAEIDLSGLDFSDAGDEPEEIDSLHVDLAAPALEEFLLALDPYPRRREAQLGPGSQADFRPESPFAALKGLKSSK